MRFVRYIHIRILRSIGLYKYKTHKKELTTMQSFEILLFRNNVDSIEKPRQILILFMLMIVVGYFGVFKSSEDPDTNLRHALGVGALIFLVHCFLQLRDSIMVIKYSISTFPCLIGTASSWYLAACTWFWDVVFLFIGRIAHV